MNWHINVNNQNFGPFLEEDLRARLSRGEISPSTMVWREGMTSWIPLGSSELMVGSGNVHQIPPQQGSYQSAPGPVSSKKNMFDYYTDALKKYATFVGRANRSEYWYFALCNFIVSFAIGFVGEINKSPAIETIQALYSLAVFIPGIAVSIRRVHDVDKSGWYLLIPFYNFVLLVTDGTRGSNKYGADTKAAAVVQPVQDQFRKAA